MKWSFKLFTLFDIPVKVHITFLFLLIFVAVVPGGFIGGFTGLSGVGVVILIFTCVLIHEFSHSLVARHYKVPVKDITLLPIGGVAQMDEVPEKPRQEIIISLAGPLASFALAFLFYLVGKSGGSVAYRPDSVWMILFQINAVLGFFNMLPAFPLDGGRALRAALALKVSWLKATRVAVAIGQLFAMVLFFAGFYINWWLSLIAIFIYLGAEGEERATTTKAAFTAVPVNVAMLTSWQSVSPSESIDDVLNRITHSLQWDFPVMEGDRLVGILPKDTIFSALRENPHDTPVSEIMIRDFYTASEDSPLEELFKKMSQSNLTLVPIMKGNELKGLINAEQLGRFQMVRAAEQESGSRVDWQKVWEYHPRDKDGK